MPENPPVRPKLRIMQKQRTSRMNTILVSSGWLALEPSSSISFFLSKEASNGALAYVETGLPAWNLKTMKSIHTSWTIAFGNALIPFLSFFFFSRTCKKNQIPFLNGRGRGGTEQNKIPLYLSLGLCAFLNLSWVGLRRRVPREISSSSPKALVESK